MAGASRYLDGARVVVVVLVVLVLGLARVALAEPNQAADATFQHGRELMAKKQYAEACTAFEQSQRLDPQPGTLFNSSRTGEVQLGKLGDAHGWRYREPRAHRCQSRAPRAISPSSPRSSSAGCPSS